MIAVKDTGIGIRPEHQRFIFDRLYRVDDARDRASGGIRIGLALAKRAASALGGHIELDSTPGRGSEFRLILPPYREPRDERFPRPTTPRRPYPLNHVDANVPAGGET